MRVLVTGGAGFIGSHIVEFLQGRAEISVLDNVRSGSWNNLDDFQYVRIKGSILDRDLVRQAMQDVDYVFHLAAMASVPESIENPVECTEINITGTLIVLEEAARAKAKRLIFSSSAAIYGDSEITPKIETMSPAPKSPYAATKLAGEVHCQRFADEGRLETVSLRYFNVFGPRQNPKSQYAAAVPAFIQRAIRNQPIVIFGDGGQTRDFVFVSDVVAANIFFAMRSSAVGTFNVARGEGITINDLALAVRDLTGSSSEIKHTEERTGDVRESVAAADKLRSAGFAPNWSLRDGLSVTIEFFKEKYKT